MHANIRDPLRGRGWLDLVMLAASLMTVAWVAFVR